MSHTQARLDTLEYYKQKASTFRNSDSIFWEHEVKTLVSFLPGGNLIEIGCGAGVEAGLLAGHYEYVGTDITAEFITVAKRNNPDLEFVNYGIDELWRLNREFDGFWCAATLLHIPAKDILEALMNICRILRVGSVGFISLKEGDGEELVTLSSEENLPPRHFTYWDRNSFTKVLRKAGFEVIDVSQKQSQSRANPDIIEKWLGFFVEFTGES